MAAGPIDTGTIDRLIAQMRTQMRVATAPFGPGAAAAPAAKTDFAQVLKASLDAANATQVHATGLARDFEAGAAGANLNDVMISMQKANLSFQQMVQVRNRLVAAYNEIMNMQV